MAWSTWPWWINVLGGAIATAVLGFFGFIIRNFMNKRKGRRNAFSQLQQRLDAYENHEKIKASLLPHNGPCYTRIENGRDMIYCSACFDDKNRLIKMTVGNDDFLICPVCSVRGFKDGIQKQR